jgi:hypothetical protein
MTTIEAAEYIGLILGSWSIGFCAGYLITVFKRAADMI